MEDWQIKRYFRELRRDSRERESVRRWFIAVLIMVAILLMLPVVGDVLHGVLQ